MKTAKAFCALFCVPLLYGFSLESLFAPKARLWEMWLTHAELVSQRVDHTVWDRILERYVVTDGSGINRFNYRGVTPEDREALDSYLHQLQKLKVSGLTRRQQLPYWINLYNAKTVQIVLDHYPVSSIRKINLGRFLKRGPWKARVLNVENKPLSLNDIEHRILRPIWKDPRIHYGVNCASVGCPNLQRESFTAENSEALLNRGARAYVNHPRGVTFKADGSLRLSSIYNWFKSDFGATQAELIEHLKRFAEPALKQRLSSARKVSDYDYDWSLNDTGSG